MNDWFDKSVYKQATESRLAYDSGLRAYMIKIYNYMALGLGLTGSVAFFTATSPAIFQMIMPMMWLFVFASMGLAFFLNSRINHLSFSTAQTLFWIYAALNGIAFSTLFLIYTGDSIARVFFITAGTFGATSLYGYTTQKDLTAIGSFLFMGLIGLIIASLVNSFLGSSMLQFVTSVVGVIVFTGMTAYDTQNLKESYVRGQDEELAGKQALFGALQLYLDFINLFISFLRLVGTRRD